VVGPPRAPRPPPPPPPRPRPAAGAPPPAQKYILFIFVSVFIQFSSLTSNHNTNVQASTYKHNTTNTRYSYKSREERASEFLRFIRFSHHFILRRRTTATARDLGGGGINPRSLAFERAGGAPALDPGLGQPPDVLDAAPPPRVSHGVAVQVEFESKL
jgi:hypothetical protein